MPSTYFFLQMSLTGVTYVYEGTVYQDEGAYIENVIIPDPMGQCGIQSLCHCF